MIEFFFGILSDTLSESLRICLTLIVMLPSNGCCGGLSAISQIFNFCRWVQKLLRLSRLLESCCTCELNYKNEVWAISEQKTGKTGSGVQYICRLSIELWVQVVQGSDWWYYAFQFKGDDYKGSPSGHKTSLHFSGNTKRPLREEHSLLIALVVPHTCLAQGLQTCRLCCPFKFLEPTCNSFAGVAGVQSCSFDDFNSVNEKLSFSFYKVSVPELGTD